MDSAEVLQDGQEQPLWPILQQPGSHDQLLMPLTSDNYQILQQVSHLPSLVTRFISPASDQSPTPVSNPLPLPSALQKPFFRVLVLPLSASVPICALDGKNLANISH